MGKIIGLTESKSWTAIAGETYCVQYKADLDAPWTSDIIGCVVASGPSATIMDPEAPNHAQRFYRVVELP